MELTGSPPLVAAWLPSLDPSCRLGSPPHVALPLAIARSFALEARVARLGWLASNAIFSAYPAERLNADVAGLVGALGLSASVGVNAAGRPVGVRLAVGGCQPEVYLPLRH